MGWPADSHLLSQVRPLSRLGWKKGNQISQETEKQGVRADFFLLFHPLSTRGR